MSLFVRHVVSLSSGKLKPLLLVFGFIISLCWSPTDYEINFLSTYRCNVFEMGLPLLWLNDLRGNGRAGHLTPSHYNINVGTVVPLTSSCNVGRLTSALLRTVVDPTWENFPSFWGMAGVDLAHLLRRCNATTLKQDHLTIMLEIICYNGCL
jgi:hypothetical protein